MDVTCMVLDTGAIVRAREAGATYAELMDMFGIGYSQLRNVLRMHGNGSPKRRERTRLMSPDDDRHIYELRDAGHGYRDIAALTGWSKGAIGDALKRRGAA